MKKAKGKKSCPCNMNKCIRAHWERCSSLIAELCERPRSEARCDISLFRYQAGWKTCLTLQINTSLREGERGHSPNQSARCRKHLGQHLATVPFSPLRASDESTCQEMKSARKQHKANVKEASVMEKGIAVFQKYPSVTHRSPGPNVHMILLRTLQVVKKKSGNYLFHGYTTFWLDNEEVEGGRSR